jgi:hypothetical protein
MFEKMARGVKEEKVKGLFFIYREKPSEEVKVRNQKWRDANRPVFGMNLEIMEKNRSRFKQYFENWVVKYGVTSLEISLYDQIALNF